jgi:hypothetical protein
MYKQAIIFIFLLSISGCEIVSVGDKNPRRQAERFFDQNSSFGAIYLFITELDSNNIPAATIILADSTGKTYNPVDQYEMYYDIARLQRKIKNKPITDFKCDTLSKDVFRYKVELDYIKNISFTAHKVNDKWYITNYND